MKSFISVSSNLYIEISHQKRKIDQCFYSMPQSICLCYIYSDCMSHFSFLKFISIQNPSIGEFSEGINLTGIFSQTNKIMLRLLLLRSSLKAVLKPLILNRFCGKFLSNSASESLRRSKCSLICSIIICSAESLCLCVQLWAYLNIFYEEI